ncbi:bifunctional 5,10-methylenetetrahydrofolate dehydrogenase/5,10-methenyltetrahydrofolate cyclohydrolase [Candidatus Berkelbacteria bacterium]|nr:bifunctional 5,10-methylenetetrahydrofolate dehydrogenase/5,10-methenyltetrahydrofolate cyclohydrolase [Candidatus Berkelbacteria bacterium]
MLFKADELLAARSEKLKKLVKSCAKPPVLALIWVGNDAQTAKFVSAKQKAAKDLGCEVAIHHFTQISERQLAATIQSLAEKKGVNGIVIQLPLPSEINTERMIGLIPSALDIDGLLPNSPYSCPTPSGIIQLLQFHKVDLKNKKTVIIGNGRLVGAPLAKLFIENNWQFEQINSSAETKIEQIKSADVVISCTGKSGLIVPEMVADHQIIIDGSGVDVDVKIIEPLVTAITPARGAIGPLTVSNLLENLIVSAKA